MWNNVTQAESEDAISKGELESDLQGIWDAKTPNNMTDFQDMLADIYYKIKNAPIVIPKRPKGEWIDKQEGTFCSECDYRTNVYHNFCPNCGADMRGAEND